MNAYRIDYKTATGDRGYFYLRARGIGEAIGKGYFPLAKTDRITQVKLIEKIPSTAIFLSERNFK